MKGLKVFPEAASTYCGYTTDNKVSTYSRDPEALTCWEHTADDKNLYRKLHQIVGKQLKIKVLPEASVYWEHADDNKI